MIYRRPPYGERLLHFRNLKITNQGTEIVATEAGKGGVSIILICNEAAHDLITGYIIPPGHLGGRQAIPSKYAPHSIRMISNSLFL